MNTRAWDGPRGPNEIEQGVKREVATTSSDRLVPMTPKLIPESNAETVKIMRQGQGSVLKDCNISLSQVPTET